MPYIDRDEAGHIVGVYASPQREGQEWTDAAELWIPPPSKLERMTARAQQVGYASAGHLISAIESARFIGAAKAGCTEEQAHLLGLQGNVMYRDAWSAWQDILQIEAEP